MPYVGDPFEYDLFISYSHGIAAGDPTSYDQQKLLREWTRRLARYITARLRMGLADDGGFEHYLDERNTESGADLGPAIENAARRSALILVVMSPFYRDSEWCRKEVRWFFDQARADGRGLEQCVLRVVVPTKHDVAANKAWPPELVGSDGTPVHSGVPFYAAETGTPIELESTRPFEDLAGHLDSLVAEIKGKLQRFRDQRRIGATPAAHARPEPRGVATTPTTEPSTAAPVAAAPGEADLALPQIYLQRHADADAWHWARQALSAVALVLPRDMEPETQELSLLSTYNRRRQAALLHCQGLVLLRAAPDEPTDLQVSSGYDDRKTLRSLAKKTLPWILVDRTGDAGPPLPTAYELPRVSANEPDWLQKLLGALEGR
jgi:hypothetical protein